MIIITVSVIALLGAIVAGIYIARKQNKAPAVFESKVEDTPAPRTQSGDKEYTQILESLLALNLLMRKDPYLPLETIQKIEAVIDEISIITPLLMDRYPGEALTFEIKRIGLNHLHKIVKEYLDLSRDSRQEQAGVFEATVKNLQKIIARSRDVVEKNEIAEFKTMATFIAGKFS